MIADATPHSYQRRYKTDRRSNAGGGVGGRYLYLKSTRNSCHLLRVVVCLIYERGLIMSSIMMDRWSIDSLYKYMGGHINATHPAYYLDKDNFIDHDYHYLENNHDIYYNDFIPQCWDNFLIAIVLWDEIWSFHQESTRNWKIIIGNQKKLM